MTYSQFQQLAESHTLVPVVRTISAETITPLAAYGALAKDENQSFLFESAHDGENGGRFTFIGVRPYQWITTRGRLMRTVSGKKVSRHEGDIFTELKRIFSAHRMAEAEAQVPFTAGAVGYIGYDTVRLLEPLASNAKDDINLPDTYLMFFDRLLAFDHARRQLHIIATLNVRERPPQRAYELALEDIAAIEKQIVSAQALRPSRSHPHTLKVTPSVSKKKFLSDVERAKEYIAAGDIFQLVLSQRLDFKSDLEPFAIYRALRQVNPSPYMYFLHMKDLHVIGSSPEMLVKVSGERIEYRPIAGTRPRGKDEHEDARLEAELRADEKERAEHIMLVDLGRNDLGRVSQVGSVKVRDLMFVERYSHVMHLVSALEGRLKSGLTSWDAFAACFPAGTLTGAPKIRAMQIIEELEPVRRGVYGGAIFYADFGGNLDSCIAIRTMLTKGKNAYVQAGAGIVADSVAESEYRECMNKAQALLKAVELAAK